MYDVSLSMDGRMDDWEGFNVKKDGDDVLCTM